MTTKPSELPPARQTQPSWLTAYHPGQAKCGPLRLSGMTPLAICRRAENLLKAQIRLVRGKPLGSLLRMLRDFPRGVRGCAASRLLAAERGAIAVEAAIVFPVLLTMFLGMVEFGQAFTVKRRVHIVASATADLVAQSQTVAIADLNNIASIGTQLMLPYSSTGLTLVITSVAEDASNNITVQWSCSWSSLSSSANCTTSGALYAGLPAGLLSAGQSVIIAQTQYPYAPAVGKFLTGGRTFSSSTYFRPRLTAAVTLQQ